MTKLNLMLRSEACSRVEEAAARDAQPDPDDVVACGRFKRLQQTILELYLFWLDERIKVLTGDVPLKGAELLRDTPAPGPSHDVGGDAVKTGSIGGLLSSELYLEALRRGSSDGVTLLSRIGGSDVHVAALTRLLDALEDTTGTLREELSALQKRRTP